MVCIILNNLLIMVITECKRAVWNFDSQQIKEIGKKTMISDRQIMTSKKVLIFVYSIETILWFMCLNLQIS